MPSILTATNISQSFDKDGQKLEVLKGISLDIKKGEFVCLIGPSGSGKSTLIRILMGLIKPTAGKIKLERGTSQALVFQNFGLFPWLTVSENVGFGLKMQDTPADKLSEATKRYIDEMGLTGFEHNHPKELSGGMKQRVGIARALAVNPEILFMDEPFSALDAFTARRLRTDTLRIWQKSSMTVVMVTHLVEEAVEMADRIVVFTPIPGQIEKIIKVDLPRPRNPRSQAFYRYVDELESLITKGVA